MIVCLKAWGRLDGNGAGSIQASAEHKEWSQSERRKNIIKQVLFVGTLLC